MEVIRNPTKSSVRIQFPSSSSTIPDSDPGRTTPNIPHELIAEILLRLPVKSLCRFKCVSSSWLSLISGSVFVKSHLKFNASAHNQRVLISRSVSWIYNLQHFSLKSLLYENVSDESGSDIDYPPFEAPLHYISVVGSCDGLICTVIMGIHVFLWNPSTRKSKELPYFWNNLKEQNCYIAWGFGYDEVSDDYKVVAVVCIRDIYGETVATKVMVFSIKTESWRRIGDFQGGYPLDEPAKFVSGKLHWLLAEEDCGYIVSFDLATEAYGLVEKPNFDKGYDHHEAKLDIFERNLCLLCDQNGDDMDVWVMNEYGVRGSWSKALTIPFSLPHRSLIIRPLCISDKGEVLLVIGTKLMLYNPKDISNVNFGFWDQNIKSYDAFLFTESLVSPHR